MAEVDVKIDIIAQQALATLERLQKNADLTTKALTRLEGGSKRIPKATDEAGAAFNRFGKSIRQTSIAMEVFRGITGAQLFFRLGRAIKEGIGRTITDFAEFEKALVGVGKTTGLAGQPLRDLGSRFQELSIEIPVSANELLRLAQVAAQLGITGSKNLEKYAVTAAKLGVATDLGAEEAIVALTRITKITGESQDNVDRLGASLVALGNTFAAGEKEILGVANELARATSGFQLTSNEVLGLSAAVSQLGIQAEGGGSAVGRVFEDMAKAIGDGGTKLDRFAKIAGVSAKELKSKFAQDAAGAFALVIQGLTKFSGNSVALTKALEELGLSNIRVRKTIRPLTTSQQELTRSMATSKQAYEDNLALNEEAARQFETVDASIEKAKNAFTRLFAVIGESNQGPIKDAIKVVTDLVNSWARVLDQSTEQRVINISGEISELNNQIEQLTKLQSQVGANTLSGIGFQKQLESLKIERTALEAERKGLQQQISDRDSKKDNENRQVKSGTSGSADQDPAVVRQRLVNEILNQEKQRQLEIETETGIIQSEIEDVRIQESLQKEIDLINQRAQLRLLDLNDAKNKNKNKAEEEAKIEAQATTDRLSAAKRAQAEQKKIDQDKLNDQQTFFSAVTTLARSENKTIAAIGKAAAVAQVAIQTPKAVASSYAFGASLGGPFLGGVFAGLASAAMAAQAAQAAGLKFEQGGIVPGASVTGDNVTARVNSGEMILNRAQQTQLFNIANGESRSSSPQEIIVNTTVELDGEVVGKSVSRQVANGLELGKVV